MKSISFQEIYMKMCLSLKIPSRKAERQTRKKRAYIAKMPVRALSGVQGLFSLSSPDESTQSGKDAIYIPEGRYAEAPIAMTY